MYIPILYHSNYGNGGSDFRTLFEALKEYKIPACGIVDGTFFGLNEFLNFAREYKIEPIIGSRILLDSASIYLFVKNKKGYKNLCQILTRYAFKNLNIEFIKEHSNGLVLLSNSEKFLDDLSTAFSNIYFLLLPNSSVLPKRRIPIIGGDDIFYVQPRERIIYRVLSIIKKFKPEDDKKRINYLANPERFNRWYYQNPEAIRNLFQFAELCNYTPQSGNWVFPKSDKRLIEIIKARWSNLNHQEKRRVEFEYKIVQEMGFEPYFVLVYELKEFAKTRGIGMNVRGSAASSFILYLLGLSVVNPIKYNLPFERFLNQKRGEPPDIDVDVEYNQREYLLREIYKKFGNDYVARISMINRFHRRSRFRDTARAYGISPAEIKKIEEHLGERLIDKILKISERIDNYPHYFSSHPSGIVITPEPVYIYAPLYPSPQGPITHFDKDGIGISGLVKIDILGVRGFPEFYLRKEEIDFDDQNVYRFISEAKTLGCFQIESPMVRQILKKIRPKCLVDIANAIAIIRPGPARGGMKQKFLNRVQKKELVDYPHPVLKDILKETLGIPVYQEQILNMASRFAGFSLEDADLLRRAITKERGSGLINEIRAMFFNQAERMNYTKKEIESVWKRISAFSSFGFNKAHSITYATLAYLSAYQKLYNPLEFFCHLLNNQGGYYPFYAYINEARRWGIRILGLDLNRSEPGFSIRNGALLTGFNSVRDLSLSAIQKILKLRPFPTAEDFFISVQLDIREGLNLIRSGALDLFGESWTGLYYLLLSKKNMLLKSRSLSPLIVKIGEFRDFSSSEKLEKKLNVLGFLPHLHILEFLYPERDIKIIDVLNSPTRLSGLTGLVIAQRTILNKNKEPITFITIDDETGFLDLNSVSYSSEFPIKEYPIKVIRIS
uniref:DNA-directed DNA polymerase n=1 Tax=candidate division WOR-3 bacterium TaxID=2052148 RepID=A0A7C4TBP7_UNCW3